MNAGARMIGLLVVAASVSTTAIPCECITVREKPWDAFRRARHVYLGEVVRTGIDARQNHVYSIQPLRAWKGPKKEYTLTSGSAGNGSCGFNFGEGQYYLIYAEVDPEEVSICGTPPMPFCEALDQIAWLDRERGLPPTIVSGVDCAPRK